MYVWIQDNKDKKEIYQYPVTRQRKALDRKLESPYEISDLATNSVEWSIENRENLPPVETYQKF